MIKLFWKLLININSEFLARKSIYGTPSSELGFVTRVLPNLHGCFERPFLASQKNKEPGWKLLAGENEKLTNFLNRWKIFATVITPDPIVRSKLFFLITFWGLEYENACHVGFVQGAGSSGRQFAKTEQDF